jgi:hypothetical protein|tara:strand:+ start:196 stop:585 length:390 start_codon:yes stop_codon:yes gene_type:complete
METLADKLQVDLKPKRKVLIIIDADPRTNPRAAEAVRLAGGVCVWEQVEVSVVLHHAAAHALSEAAADLPDSKMYKQFLPMVREKGGRVYVMPDEKTMEALDAEVILKNHLKEPALAKLTAEAEMVMRF